MIKLKSILFLLICIVFFLKGNTQTPYISQSFNNLQFFNPATTGFGSYNRFSSIYRSQFSNVGRPYKTIGLNLDFGFLKNEGADMNNLGFGIQGLSEQILDGILQTNSITGTIADRIFFDDYGRDYLALGVGATYISKTIDYASLNFGDQYIQGKIVNPTSLDIINKDQNNNTINVGILFSHNSDNAFFQMGASTYLLNRSIKQQTYKDTSQVDFTQLLGQVNYERIILENKSLMFHANYQNRYENILIYAGTALGISFNETYESTNRLYVGCFYRQEQNNTTNLNAKTIVPYIGILLNKFKFGLTYDIYNNDMTTANLKPQTFEFTLSTYFGKRRNEGMRSLFD